jgi:hypothetical protein
MSLVLLSWNMRCYSILTRDSDWTSPRRRVTWDFGAFSDSTEARLQSTREELEQLEPIVCRVHGAVNAKREREMRYQDQNKIVVGYRIKSHWDDGTNGDFKISSGDIGGTTVAVDVKTQKSRGGHWSLTVWVVDRSKYQYV